MRTSTSSLKPTVTARRKSIFSRELKQRQRKIRLELFEIGNFRRKVCLLQPIIQKISVSLRQTCAEANKSPQRPTLKSFFPCTFPLVSAIFLSSIARRPLPDVGKMKNLAAVNDRHIELTGNSGQNRCIPISDRDSRIAVRIRRRIGQGQRQIK